MTIRLETVGPEHFAAVEGALLRPMNPRMSSTVWRRLFTPSFGTADRPLGAVLLDGEQPVGFAAFVHADLPRASGETVPLCSISSWVIEPAHSSRAMSVVMPALQLRGVTITNFTPIHSVHEIFTRLGFRTLEARTRRLYPATLAPRGWPSAELVTDCQRIVERLPAWESRVAATHRDLARHLCLFGADGRHCYAAYQITRRRGLRTANLLWVTPGTLPEASVVLRRALLRISGAIQVDLEARMCNAPTPASREVALEVPRLFRSDRLDAAEIPSAFSELALLGI